MSKQRKKTSLVEAIVNCIVGIGVAVTGQLIVFPLFGIYIPLSSSGLIALIFTGISIVRSYALRRVFEWLRVTGIMP